MLSVITEISVDKLLGEASVSVTLISKKGIGRIVCKTWTRLS